MADAKDVATVVQSALSEIGVTGKLRVTKDGENVVGSLGHVTGEDVAVDLVVKDLAANEDGKSEGDV